jgi:hypothetical protein
MVETLEKGLLSLKNNNNPFSSVSTMKGLLSLKNNSTYNNFKL